METNWRDKLLVAAIDFGTTFSGFAISFYSDYKKDKSILTTQWKSGDRPPTHKTPTCLLLKSDNSFHSFGYEAEQKYTELAEEDEHKDWKYFQRFKMKLYNSNDRNTCGLSFHSKIKDSEGRDMDAMVVFAYSIQYMKNKIVGVVAEKCTGVREDDIHYVITVPAIWSEQAKKFMNKAALNARIPRERLRLALEPECAAVYALYKMPNYNHLMTPGSCYMIVDIGGGTLDIAAHRVLEGEKFEEIIAPDGGPFGGDNINMKFEQFLIKITGGPVFTKFKDQNMSDYLHFLHTFDNKKCAFNVDGDQKRVVLQMPLAFTKLHKKENKEKLSESVRGTTFSDEIEIIGDKMKLTTSLFKSFFTDTVDSVTGKIQEVLHKIPVRIDTIICVGGFSDCGILKKALRERLPDKAIIIPEEAVTSIMKGAIMYGRDRSIVTTRISRYTIGLDWNEDFDENAHDPRKREESDDGPLCRDIFRKLIRKGEPIQCDKPTQEIEAYTKSRYQTHIEFPFYRSEILESPVYVDEIGCHLLGTMKINLGAVGQFSVDRCVKLKVYFGAAELKAEAVDDTGNVYEVTYKIEDTDI